MQRHVVCNVADYDIYLKQCAALEKHIPGLVRIEELHDVDDSRIMIYQRNGLKLRVTNSFFDDGVYVESEFPLEPFFPKLREQAV